MSLRALYPRKHGFGVGKRMKLKYTRAIIDAIHSGELRDMETVEDSVFGVAVPVSCPGVPTEILQPRNTWTDGSAYDAKAAKLAQLFAENFETYREGCNEAVLRAGPKVAVS